MTTISALRTIKCAALRRKHQALPSSLSCQLVINVLSTGAVRA